MDALVSLVNSLEAWHWAAFALVLLIGEVSTGTTFLLWPAASAGITALAAWLGNIQGPWQLGLFATLTLVLTLLGPRYVRGRWLKEGEPNTLNERGISMVGQRGQALEAFVNGVGAVKLGDTRWRALSSETLGPGDSVVVTGADGPTLTVKRA